MKMEPKKWLVLGASLIFVGLIVYNMSRSPEWRHFDWGRTWASFTHARPGFLVLAVAAVYASYLIRAYRWKVFVDPIKKASLWACFAGQVLGFSSVYLVGRAGEFVRPAYIAKKENLPITTMLAVWLLERVFDSVFLLLLSSVAISLLPKPTTISHDGTLLETMRHGGEAVFGLTALAVSALVAFRLQSEKLIAGMLKVIGFLPERARLRIGVLLGSFADGLEVIRSWQDFAASVTLTAILWLLNISVFWLVLRSVGNGLEGISWLDSAPLLFCASLGLMVQFPGIGGGYQVGIILGLTEFYGVQAAVATGGAILIWLVMSVPCVILGVALLVHEGLSIRKLEAIVKEERLAASK